MKPEKAVYLDLEGRPHDEMFRRLKPWLFPQNSTAEPSRDHAPDAER